MPYPVFDIILMFRVEGCISNNLRVFTCLATYLLLFFRMWFEGPRDGPHLLRQRGHGRVQLGASGRSSAAAGAGAAAGAREAGQVVRGLHVTPKAKK